MDVRKISRLVRFDSQKMRKVNLFESQNMFCDLYCLEPEQQQSVHTHAGSDKIYCVVEGEGTFRVGSETRVLKAGEAVCAWSGQPHGVENRSQSRLTCLVFMAPHPSLEKSSGSSPLE